MKNLVVAVVLVVACMAPAFAADSYNGHLYEVVSGNWTAAESAAVALGGHLVTINDVAEQNWLLSQYFSGSENKFWIGLNDAASEGTFVWSSGESSSYFHLENANNANKDYVALYKNSDWKVLNFDDSGVKNGIAEIVPEPISAGLFLLGGGALAVIRRKRHA
jgi:hypothetical protein